MPYSGCGEVIFNEKAGPEHFLMRVSVPQLANEAIPGQFVHVRCNEVSDPLLRRPISLNDIDKSSGTIDLLYQVIGRGTRLLSQIATGAEIDIMGPLGKGFIIPGEIRNVVLIGGGIGAAPLFPLVRELRQKQLDTTVLLGARTEEYLMGISKLEALGARVKLATDDGSAGIHGFVTELAEYELGQGHSDYFFACGPTPMLKGIVESAAKHGIKGQVSLEEYMGCGVGGCLACVCKIKTDAAAAAGSAEAANSRPFKYLKVCTDGPVFEASEVIFDD